MNPLLDTNFSTPHQATPFDKIEPSHFIPALEHHIKEAKQKIEKIKTTDKPDFHQVIEALEVAGRGVGTIAGIFFNLHSAHSSDELQKVAKDFSPLLTNYENDIALDLELFAKVSAVYENRDKQDLTMEQKRLLEKTYKSFARNGAKLEGDKKEKLRALDQELSSLSLKFGDNVLHESNSFKMFIFDEQELEGLPASAIEAAAFAAKEAGEDGKWLFTLDYPSYIPFMTFSKNRGLREKMYRAFSSKAAKGNEYDNQEIVKKIAKLRHERASLLGYASHADYVLEERMAERTQTVQAFLENLLTHAKPAALAETQELKDFAKELDGLDDLQAWDAGYYAEKLKEKKYAFDQEAIKPYFKLENVIDGVFTIAKKLYGLNFEPVTNIPTYHQDVKTFEVKDDAGNFISLFYADFFPRSSKRNGAWMTSYRSQYRVQEKDVRPHVSIVCNFTKPTATKPSLLTFNEVTTLFHEFGHALHGMLANSTYESLSGTSVLWDFVELPSQIFENWAYEKECLDLFAKHYETGELIPNELITKIKEASNFHAGRAAMRQVSFAMLDMSWHSGDPSGIKDVFEFEAQKTQETQLLPHVEGTTISCAFSHIFQGGYSAGYYSYKWAEVLDADAFELFKEKGIFDAQTAKSFKENILSKGDSEHPMQLYKKFRGDEPNPEALLRRAGLIS